MKESQVRLSDRELLLLMNAEPDRILNAENLAKKSGMSQSQARTRLHRLHFEGVVNVMSSGVKYFYELKVPIEKENLIDLSDKPFISIEDLFILFDHFNHKMSLQDICIATGLPFRVIKEEMKYFAKEGIVHKMIQHNPSGSTPSKFFTLQDNHKRRTDGSAEGQKMNLDLEQIYQKISKDGEEYV